MICGVYTDLRSVVASLKSLEPDLRWIAVICGLICGDLRCLGRPHISAPLTILRTVRQWCRSVCAPKCFRSAVSVHCSVTTAYLKIRFHKFIVNKPTQWANIAYVKHHRKSTQQQHFDTKTTFTAMKIRETKWLRYKHVLSRRREPEVMFHSLLTSYRELQLQRLLT